MLADLGAWCNKDSALECVTFRSLLHVRFANGAEEIRGSKASSWKAREGPVLRDDYYYVSAVTRGGRRNPLVVVTDRSVRLSRIAGRILRRAA